MKNSFKCVISLVLVFFCLDSISQNVNWVKSNGSTSADQLYRTVVDAQGNTYSVGRLMNIINWPVGNPMTVSENSFFMVKYNSAGTFQWAKTIAANGQNWSLGIKLDNAGHIYISGWFSGTADFGTPYVGSGTINSINGPAQDDGFIGKYTTNGDLVWVKRFGGSGLDYPTTLVLDDSCNIYVSGHTNSSNFTAGNFQISNSGSYDVFLLKLDSTGTAKWLTKSGGAGGDYCSSLAIDNIGNLIVGGYYTGSTQIAGVSTTSAGSNDFYIIKYNKSGSSIWVANGGGTSSETVASIEVDLNNNVYFAGQTSSSYQFKGQSFSSASAGDGYVAKLDAAGNLLWRNIYGGTSSDNISSITLFNNKVYAAGSFSSTVQFSTSVQLTSAGLTDAFLVGMNQSDGQFFNTYTFGGTQADALNNVHGSGENLYLGGIISSSQTIGGTSITHAGSGDFALISLNPIVASPSNASSLSFTNVSTDSLVVNINPGNGSGRIVVARKQQAVSVLPKDQVQYSSHSVFGTGSDLGQSSYVVYKGAGSSFTIKGLLPNTKYYFAVHEYNGIADSVNYLTSTYGTGSQFTKALAGITGNASFCTGDSTQLTALVSTNVTYQWTKDNVQIQGATGTTYYATSSGAYRVLVTNEGGTSTSEPVNVTVKSLPQFSFQLSGNDTICNGDSVMISATYSASYTYQWLLNNLNISGQVSNSHMVKSAGNYSVKVTDNTTSCEANSSVQQIAVYAVPTITYVLSNNDTICDGDSVIITGIPSSGLNTYEWQKNNATIGGANASQFKVTATGAYNLKVSYAAAGCYYTAQPVTIYVNPLPTASITSPASATVSFCQGDSAVLQAAVGNGYHYQWRMNNSSLTGETQTTYVAKVSGSFSVVVTDNFGCSSTSSDKQITANTAPSKPSINNNGNLLSTPSGFTYQWYFNGNILPNEISQTLTATQTGLYTVKITDGNGCFNVSDPYSFTTGVDNPHANNSLQVYPNPNNGNFNAQFSVMQGGEAKLALIDLLGKVVYSGNQKVFAGRNTISIVVDNLASGVYFFQLQVEGKTTFVKIRVD